LQVFRQTQGVQTGYGEPHFMKGLVLYTKEDFQAAVRRVQSNRYLDDKEVRERIRALRHFRKWVLSDTCRLQSMAAYYQGASMIEVPPCGKCDRCLAAKNTDRFSHRALQKLMQRWLY